MKNLRDILNAPSIFQREIIDIIRENGTIKTELGNYKHYQHRNLASANCPSALVIPDDPSDKEIEWIGTSGCALGCKSPIWTEQEWSIFLWSEFIASYLGLIPILATGLTWTFNRGRRKQYIVTALMWSALIYSVATCALTATPFEKRYCRNNAVPIGPKDGFNICNYEAIGAAQYFGLVFIYSWFSQALDIFLRVVRGWHTTLMLRPYYLAFIFVTPLYAVISIVAVAAQGRKSFGYFRGMLHCWIESPMDMWTFIFPAFSLFAVGFFMMVTVMYKLYQDAAVARRASNLESKNVDDDSCHSPRSLSSRVAVHRKEAKGPLKVLKQPLAFVVLTFLGIIPWWVWRLDGFRRRDEMPAVDMDHWLNCILDNFNGDDSVWRRICGAHPPNRSDPVLTGLSNMCLFSVPIFVSSIYMLSPSLWKLWYYYFWSLLGYKLNFYVGTTVLPRVSAGALSLTSMRTLRDPRQRALGTATPEERFDLESKTPKNLIDPIPEEPTQPENGG